MDYFFSAPAQSFDMPSFQLFLLYFLDIAGFLLVSDFFVTFSSARMLFVVTLFY